MNNIGTFTALPPLNLLRQLSNCLDTTRLQAESNLVTWLIYLKDGTLNYATHSVEPFDRLERHLRRLSQRFPLVTPEIRVQLRLLFEADSPHLANEHHPPDYQAIQWLMNQGYLDTNQATLLIQELVKEVMEAFFFRTYATGTGDR